ncbi:hypothetical protein Tbd_2818 [Thiobacillus denitrificans ATCC 25259]|uniref:Uncharacterized protein n=1 Tax=Thiobacillus denitrificans (strain ATCC 25259 / T1) TaxID=292415 RepID=Q3SF45_THIDA|nr:hypothetical protein Tbd_2818 [Thiobacillus denitrificans ATCC 25259]
MALADLLERLERRTDTPDTPRNPVEVSTELAPILACTPDTPDTPQNINSEGETLGPETFHDDRRTCDQCANLEGRRCLAAWRGEIVANRDYEPIRDLLRRCEGYTPRAS